MSRFFDAANTALVEDSRDGQEGRGRQNGRHLPASTEDHVLAAMGAVRLGEATTPLVDKVIAAIKTDVGSATAKSCRSVISGVWASLSGMAR